MKKLLSMRGRILISLLLISCVILTLLCGCTRSKTEEYHLSENVVSSGIDKLFSSNPTPAKKSGKIAESGITTLFMDKQTKSPIIKNQDVLWRSLPKSIAKGSEYAPAVFTLEVLYEGQKYILNSQTDAVKHTEPIISRTDNGVCAEYAVSFENGENTVTVNVPVTFSLEDGSFIVSLDCANIKVSDGDYVITKISLMDFFGSDTDSESGDYILVPDGSGALIDTHKAKKSFDGVSFKVYGDIENSSALAGFYGMKKGDGAFIAMIEKGEALAKVNAYAAAGSGYNRVGAEFEITETKEITVREEKKILVSGESYDGEIKICYRFLSGGNANYSGMAIACREHLIRSGILSGDTVDAVGDLPFILSTVGEGNDKAGKAVSLTSYEQLLDMLTYLKGKGFSEIFIRYKGALTGGTSQSVITKCEKLKTLGSQDDFKELADYISAQQMKLFFDMGFVSCSQTSTKFSDLASDISGSLYFEERQNLLGYTSKLSLSAYDRIDDNVISIFRLSEENGISNISINDASVFLYSDLNNSATRDDVKEMIRKESLSLTTIGDLMVEKGNFYMLKNASLISSLPTVPSLKESSFYTGVPFVPFVLHGIVQYSTEPLNLSTDYTKAMLRSVEYGALPQFEWCYEDIASENQNEAENTEQTEEASQINPASSENEAQEQGKTEMKPYSYSDWATPAYTFYEKANRALGDIRGSRMTAHYKVRRGVYCTEYGDTSVYVNYTDKDVTISGVTVPANDFMRIN